MQKKTIEKVIKQKLENWLSTITDKTLIEKVKKDLLVSGGSIASLFLGEQVNDYDIYLKTVETAKDLAKYYCKAFPEINIFTFEDKYTQLKRFEDKVGEEYVRISKIFFQNLKSGQVKLHLPDFSGFKTQFEDSGEGKYLPVFFSPNAISLSDQIQIVLRFTGDNEQIHKTFDFVHATNYFTFETGLVTNISALESLLTKQLKYQGSLYPLTSVIRVKKFLKRNWNINAGEQLKMMFQISELDLTDFNTLEDQLIGVDVAYFGLLIDSLRSHQEKNPDFKLTSDYLSTLIDKIFAE